MNQLRQTLYSLYKAFFIYRSGFRYVYYRYYCAPQIRTWKYPIERPVTHPDLSMHMLTCHRDALIAAWSLASFYQVSEVIGHLTLHDDGTLTHADIAMFKRLFPSVTIHDTQNFLSAHGTVMLQHPHLEVFRRTFPQFQSKKILDVFLERKGSVVLLLDSDLLWFTSPSHIKNAIESGDIKTTSYMMSNHPERIHVTYKDGSMTSDHVAECNSGVTLFHEQNYALDAVEKYIQNTDYPTKDGSVYSDQACFGTVLTHVHILPREQYFIKGTITEDTIMRHYTGPSREKFFFYGIDRIAKKILKKE